MFLGSDAKWWKKTPLTKLSTTTHVRCVCTCTDLMCQTVSDVHHDPPPLKLLVCQADAVVVQDAAELVLPDVSFSVVVKQVEHSDHGPQVASDLRGSHTVIDSNSNTTPRWRL